MNKQARFLMITALVVVLTLGAGLNSSCSKSPQEKKTEAGDTIQAVREEKPPAPPGIPGGRGRQIRQHGQEPFGRGFGGRRGWRNAGLITLSEEEKKVVEIKTDVAAFRPMRTSLRAMGKVLAPQTKKAIVSYAFPARIAEIHVTVGDWVKKNQKLVTLQSEEVGSARAEFFKARADFELAKRNLERERSLFQRGVGAGKNLLAAETEFKVAEAHLEATEKKLHVLGFTEEQLKEIERTHQVNPVISLYAPIEGKVIHSNAVLGAMVDQNTEILTIMDPTLLWVDGEIYERDIAKIKKGQDVGVSVPAYAGEVFWGKIGYISDVLNEQSRTITVRTEVKNSDQKLKPGMFADMTIYLDHQEQVLVVPEAAVLDDQNDKIVFVPAEGGFRVQVVQVGIKEAGFLEIVAGLEAGQEVVTNGNYQLKSKMYEEILRRAEVH